MTPTEKLCSLLETEQLDRLLFRSCPAPSELPHVFGGQVLAQALNAAIRTVVDDRQIHSLHAYFLRPGDINRPIIFDVDPIRDGGSFTTRRVVAKQNGKAIFNAAFSFQIPEQGLEHQDEMPEIPLPQTLRADIDEIEQLRKENPTLALPPNGDIFGAFELRTHGPLPFLQPKQPIARQGYWLKTVNPVAGDQSIHQALLAYMSDYRLMGTALIPHGVMFHDANMQAASLDHSMWFHAPFRADEWLYYDMDSPISVGGRGLNFGRIYTADGRLVASTAQEGLMRVR